MGDDRKNDMEEPRSSMAASCILIHFLDSSFQPEFTHQIFEGERIPGYEPWNDDGSVQELHSLTMLTTSNNNLSKSDEENDMSKKDIIFDKLKIHITLAPSWNNVFCDITVREIRKRKCECLNQDRREAQMQSSMVTDNISDRNNQALTPRLPTEEGNTNKASMAMSKVEILDRLSNALPRYSEDKLAIQNSFMRKPVGETVLEYSRFCSQRSRDLDFVLTLADGEFASEYHHSIQNLALFFIENADAIDLTSTPTGSGGFWKILYLFLKQDTFHYALCGYMTLFHFHSPFRKPNPGIVVRICQALILPPFQRQGHGKVMLRTVYDTSLISAPTMDTHSRVIEINVEDPAPAFAALRNAVDWDLLRESIQSNRSWIPNHYLEEGTFNVLQDKDVHQAAIMSRIIPQQIHIAYELWKLSQISEQKESERQYRLMVKKRLLKNNRDILSSFDTREERQAVLDEIWKKQYQGYKAILKRK
jgi:histone acetyltransferase 1